MRLKFMSSSMIIPGSNSSGRNIDVYLQLLIDELKHLWPSKTLTYDVLRKQNFQMKATLIWIINNFLRMEWFFVGAHMIN